MLLLRIRGSSALRYVSIGVILGASKFWNDQKCVQENNIDHPDICSKIGQVGIASKKVTAVILINQVYSVCVCCSDFCIVDTKSHKVGRFGENTQKRYMQICQKNVC